MLQLANTRHGHIWHIRAPGYIWVQQVKRNNDCDVVQFVAGHPGHLFHRYNENVTLYDCANKTQATWVRPGYVANRMVFVGDALPDGDTWQSSITPINPGSHTYMEIAPDSGSTTGCTNYSVYFVPAKGVPVSAAPYVRNVGVTESWLSQGSSGLGTALARAADVFSGSWMNVQDSIMIPHIRIRGTNWNWNNTDSGTGRLFKLDDATVIGSNRCWRDVSNGGHQVRWYPSIKKWYLSWQRNACYQADDPDGTANPWDLAWRPGPDESFTIPPEFHVYHA